MRMALVLAATFLASLSQGTRDVPANLLLNPRADEGTAHWLTQGDASAEQMPDNACFLVRNKGQFRQKVILPAGSGGGFLVALGLGASERINPEGYITGLPYLYGLLCASDGMHILGYMTEQNMLARPTAVNEWVPMWGIYPVPEGTGWVWFELKQAERKDVPQSGSAARFDDLALFLVGTKTEANALVQSYVQQHSRTANRPQPLSQRFR